MQLVVGVALLHHGRVLAARRCRPPEAAGGWEFPGGKVDEGEDPAAAAVRELREELGCTVEVTGWLATTAHIDGDHELRVAVARVVEGDPVPAEHDAVRWLRADQLDDVDWLPADRPFTEALRKRLGGEN